MSFAYWNELNANANAYRIGEKLHQILEPVNES